MSEIETQFSASLYAIVGTGSSSLSLLQPVNSNILITTVSPIITNRLYLFLICFEFGLSSFICLIFLVLAILISVVNLVGTNSFTYILFKISVKDGVIINMVNAFRKSDAGGS